jgi:hypothetical protein
MIVLPGAGPGGRFRDGGVEGGAQRRRNNLEESAESRSAPTRGARAECAGGFSLRAPGAPRPAELRAGSAAKPLQRPILRVSSQQPDRMAARPSWEKKEARPHIGPTATPARATRAAKAGGTTLRVVRSGIATGTAIAAEHRPDQSVTALCIVHRRSTATEGGRIRVRIRRPAPPIPRDAERP